MNVVYHQRRDSKSKLSNRRHPVPVPVLFRIKVPSLLYKTVYLHIKTINAVNINEIVLLCMKTIAE